MGLNVRIEVGASPEASIAEQAPEGAVLLVNELTSAGADKSNGPHSPTIHQAKFLHKTYLCSFHKNSDIHQCFLI